ncbi:MAG: RNA polymerase sigma factor [Actinomycetota bacterium]|nr:RNA polymerase sigma factor [Actinomycetota bacterium]
MSVAADRGRWSDERLLAAIAGRDREAFSVFYTRHLPPVLGYLMRETRDPELAADLAAEVFASMLLAARRYRAEHASALPWVIGVARNVLGSSRRRNQVEDRARRRLGLAPIEFDDADLERICALADSEHSRVTELLERLPAVERAAVRARIVQERSYAEVAGALRCSEMVARKRVSRGLGRIREGLQERHDRLPEAT